MKHFIPGPLSDKARNLMRRIGYGEHTGRGGQLSYTKRIQSTPYPRYHAYVEDKNGGIQVNLHLDQKKASYSVGAAHGGEYEGPLVEREMERIVSFVSGMGAGSTRTMSRPQSQQSTQRPTPKRSSSVGDESGGLWD